MRFLLLVVFLPLLLIPVAAVGLHLMACGMHITSADALFDRHGGTQRQGRFYSYCQFMAAPLRRIVT
jgi:hypothetical protein